jgi:hypothetical protein
MSATEEVYKVITAARTVGETFNIAIVKNTPSIRLTPKQIGSAIHNLKMRNIVASVEGRRGDYRLIAAGDFKFLKRKTTAQKSKGFKETVSKVKQLEELDALTIGTVFITAYKNLEDQVRKLSNQKNELRTKYKKINSDLMENLDATRKQLKEARQRISKLEENVCTSSKFGTVKFSEVLRIAGGKEPLNEENKTNGACKEENTSSNEIEGAATAGSNT